MGAAFFIQMAAGALNYFLRAPIWMQLVHLLLADAVWIILVLIAAGLLLIMIFVGTHAIDASVGLSSVLGSP